MEREREKNWEIFFQVKNCSSLASILSVIIKQSQPNLLTENHWMSENKQ